VKNLPTHIQADVTLVSSIPAVTSLLKVVCRTTGMGFAAVARVTDDRWVACAVCDEINFGLEPGGELVVETTLCHEVRKVQEKVVIDNVAEDPVYAGHHTPAIYGLQSYISVPITLKNGDFFGTLCAIDPKPARLNTPETIGMFELFADLIAFHLHTAEQMALTETKLQEERKVAGLRDQFIAILGHDLRNPVSAVANSAQILQKMPLDDQAKRFVIIIQDSTYRINGLIENVLDFARGRLGDGITLNRKDNEPLEPIINQVITGTAGNTAATDHRDNFLLKNTGKCDGKRIAQLFSNLLTNALKHGKADAPVKVEAFSDKEAFVLSVINKGKKIPAAVMDKLFQPFSRAK
jgi:signal transduction histidine kinase